MGVIGTALSMSLDGFIAGQDGRAGGLHAWLTGGETPSRTYDVSGAWDGRGPIPGLPLVILTHRVPGSVPAGDPPYTFVTDGIGRAVERARRWPEGRTST